ncbi:MAG: LamG-like jellyroll fold domain-containing protein [Thermoanaerobaculia bacterium]
MRGPLNVILCLVALAGCGDGPANPDGTTPAAAAETGAATAELGSEIERARLGDGFVVWESSRAGDWRIWTRRLDGSGLRQLSPDEPGRQHCCPQVSPDGLRVAFLSRQIHRIRKPKREIPGTLELIAVDGSVRRTLAPSARTAGRGHRAVVWRDAEELIYIDGDGNTRLLEIDGGVSRLLLPSPGEDLGWLVDPTLSYATTGFPTFSPYDADQGRVLQRQRFGGCEPYFSGDGSWGYWVAGAGGPVHRIDLATREVSIVLRKNDARLAEQGYVYFPIRSRDGRLFAFGASAGGHDHATSNYDVYVAHTDPRSFKILGKPVRLTADAGSDRYPDVFAEPLPPGFDLRELLPETDSTVPEAAAERLADAAPGWPSSHHGLVFLWQTGDQPNLVFDPELDAETTYPLTAKGRARLDRNWAMVLGEGVFEAAPEAAERLFTAARSSNELTLEVTLQAADPVRTGPARIVTFSTGPRRRNFTLGQEGRWLVVRVRTGLTGPDADRPQVKLFELPPDRPLHVVVTYSPGLLTAYRDGKPVTATAEIQEGFFHWQPGKLLFGDEIGGGAPWTGTLEGLAIYNRVLEADEVRESYSRYRQILDAREPVPRLEARAALRAKSALPTLDQISPYRQALVVYEYEVESVVSGAQPPNRRVRVAHWVILDEEILPVSRLAIGDSVRLSLEPFSANPQLESHFLSDTLEVARDLPLYYQIEFF